MLQEVTKMIAQCPSCDKPGAVRGLGRKPLNIPSKNVCEALQTCSNVVAAANELGCSRALIYKILKQHGMTPADVIEGQKRC